MPTKGKFRRMTSKTPYDIYKEASLRKNTRERKSGRFRKRFSAKLRFALVFRLALLFCSGVCLAAEARSADALVYAKHTPQCQVT